MNGKTAVEFNKRFNKLYNKIPNDIKPSQATAEVTYVKVYESNFSMMMRERRSVTL